MRVHGAVGEHEHDVLCHAGAAFAPVFSSIDVSRYEICLSIM